MNKKTKEIEYIKINKKKAAQILRGLENEYEKLPPWTQNRIEDLCRLFNFMPRKQLKRLQIEKIHELDIKYRAPYEGEKRFIEKEGVNNG